jgi:hypothetical protein
VQLPVTIATGNYTCDGKMINVSEGGLALRGNLGTAEGSALKLSFDAPGGTVEAVAQIVWADALGTMGLQFVHMGEEARHRLQQWVELLRAGHQEEDTPDSVGVLVPRLVH